MSALAKRIDALEAHADGGLVLLLISGLPSAGETATYEGVTYTQERGESAEQFRDRLAEVLERGKKRFLWLSKLDAAL